MIQAFGLTSNPRKDLPPAVDDVSFEARAGRVTALLGAPGAGRTTVLRLMLELQQGRGITYFRGRPLHRIAHPSREVGVLLGDVPGHPARTVRGHLRMLCAAAGVPVRRADEVLEVVGLVSLRDERLGTLSRGMDRRLGLACALLSDPHTLVLDEPADGLSTRETGWLYGMLRAHAAQGGTVLLTTADPKEAARNADRVITLEQGRLVADQDVAEFARTRLRPRVAVRSPHAARLAALLTKEARTAQRSVEIVREGGNRLSVYGSTCADVGETAFRHGILVHQLADEIGDMGPGAGATPPAVPDATEGSWSPAASRTADAYTSPADAPATATGAPATAMGVPATATDAAATPTDVPATTTSAPATPTGAPAAATGLPATAPDAHTTPADRPPTDAGGPHPGAPRHAPSADASQAADPANPAHPHSPDHRHLHSTPRPLDPRAPLSPLPPPISVRPAPSPLRPLRYEIRRATGIGTGFLTAAAVLLVSALTAVLLARIGHTPQSRLLVAWPREVPLPPAALGAGLLGALAFGDEFRHPALAADRGTVPRRLGLLVAKLLVAAATALTLAFLTVGCDAEVLYLVYGRELAQVPADWLSLSASWIGLVVGCAWAGVLAAGVFRSTTAGLAAVVAVPVLVVPLVQKALEGSSVRTAAGLPMRLRETLLLQWPFGGERYLSAAVRVLAQPVGGALTLSLTALLCAYLLTTLRGRVR
ncbi:ABC transporter ATP-binding protein [Streptomyces cylindrosporus]|uniref:ABC transporter ATP-binding protein n=1 Tax=Streptomyces cylindrosporus TaxID=2927583 RepID=A0ABS9Y3W1_9ACTN|nr:ABC transporter ATP-binding protein [Streptomyces cylindrosporus]MCI3271903.1 ABC transporter ATP-binding protein [Streptomyces cylindrosporus]